MIAFTSLIIFAFAVASNFSNLTVKIVFSFGFSTSSAASAGAAPPAGAAAAEGIATSVMFNFVLRADTSSETSRRDRVEIWSTSGAILAEVEDEASAESARRREEEAKDRYRGVGCILGKLAGCHVSIGWLGVTYLETELARSATRRRVLVDRYCSALAHTATIR